MNTFLKYLEIPALIVVPVVLVSCLFFQFDQTALLTLLVVIAALVVFFARFELSKPSLRQIMPAVIMGALTAVGRILFAPIPNFKPVTAICIVAGIVFGRHVGFVTGALAALVSNFFFGQGPWTPWQMYAWGLTGYFAGVLADAGLFGMHADAAQADNRERGTHASALKQQLPLYIYGVVASLLYGFILNTWTLSGFAQPLTWQVALATYGAGLAFDIIHAASTVTFLAVIMIPWRRKLERIKRKYALHT